MAELGYALMFIAAAFAGFAAGIITGILPGLHINLVAVIVASLIGRNSSSISMESSFAAAIFILAMSISHVFHDFLPSIFLGFSESEAALAVLPGHRLLLRGQGRKAVMLASFGALVGVLALAALSPLLLAFMKPIFNAAKSYVLPALVVVIAVQIARSRSLKDAAAKTFIIALAGSFGIVVFRLPNLSEPLLPMFSGLFAISSLIGGLLHRSSFPPQQPEAVIRIRKVLMAAKTTAVGLFSSSLMGLFPSLGPAQAALLGTTVIRKIKAPAYIFLLGVISSASMLMALLTLYSFGKARNGSIAVMGSIIPLTRESVLLLLVAAVIAAFMSCMSALFLSRLFLQVARKINYSLLCWIVIVFIIAFVAAFSGPIGLLVLAVAAMIGMVPVLTRSSRQLLMACLMVPVIGYYL